MWSSIIIVILYAVMSSCQFYKCHDDPTFDPEDGPLSDLQFTWLGSLQYIHVKNGTPHHFRVPRIVLISRQFALSTAVDAAAIPSEYALGNVIFGDYERDEHECGIQLSDLADGADCEPAVLLMPIADVLLHPEYKHFGAKNSIALLKLLTPIKSKYMLPACLPFKDFLFDKDKTMRKSKLYHIDYYADVPRDYVEEEKEISFINLLPRELCYLYDKFENSTAMTRNRIVCSTGCGFVSGAPTIVHEHTGHWSLVALATGGTACPDPLRPRRPPPPPRHIMIHPYVPWITAAISGKAVGAFAKDDPFGFVMPRASVYDEGHNWLGHWWMGGIHCYDRGESADHMFKFYHEVFLMQPVTQTYLTYYLEIDAAHGTMIICVKVGMPYQMVKPRVWELHTPIVKVRIPMLKFRYQFKFQVEAWAHNVTEEQDLSDSDIYSSSSEEEEAAE